MEYQVVKDGNRWGLWGMRSNCIIVYGTKKRLEKLSDHLNKKEATK
jgi:hypothetical protein